MANRSAPPRVAILTEVADLLADRKDRQRLRSLSLQLTTYHSCLSDLRYCSELLNLLESDSAVSVREEIAALLLQHSIISNVVILYARSTGGGAGNGGRGSVDIRAFLSDIEKADHKKIVDFRNKTIAHVHIGHDMDGYVWNPSYAVAVEEDEGFSFGAVSRPLSVRPSIAEAVSRAVPRAKEIIKLKYDRYLDLIMETVIEKALQSEINARLQDSAALLGSAEAARSVLENRASGSTFGVGRDL